MISLPRTVAVLDKNDTQQLRIQIVELGGRPLTRLQLLERDQSGKLHVRPGAPGVPRRLVGAVAAAFAKAERLIGGAA